MGEMEVLSRQRGLNIPAIASLWMSTATTREAPASSRQRAKSPAEMPSRTRPLRLSCRAREVGTTADEGASDRAAASTACNGITKRSGHCLPGTEG